MNAVSGKDITFDYAVAGVTAIGGGNDFLLADGAGTIAAGEASATLVVRIDGDALYEGMRLLQSHLAI